MSRDHRKLMAFQLADDLVLRIYAETRSFPREELFGLTSQMRRAAVSVAANIVEGCARIGDREFGHALNMAFGSLRELGYYVNLSARLGYMPATDAAELNSRYDETARVLSGLQRSISKFAAHAPNTAQVSKLKSQVPRLNSQVPRLKSQDPRLKSQDPRPKTQDTTPC